MLRSVEAHTRQFRSRTPTQQAFTAMTMATIAQRKKVREDIKDSGCISSLVTMLRRADSDVVKGNICQALVNLALDERNHSEIMRYEGLDLILSLIKSRSPRTACRAAGVVCNLAVETQYHRMLQEKYIIETLLLLLRDANSDSALVACAALVNLTRTKPIQDELALVKDPRVRLISSVLRDVAGVLGCSPKLDAPEEAGLMYAVTTASSGAVLLVLRNPVLTRDEMLRRMGKSSGGSGGSGKGKRRLYTGKDRRPRSREGESEQEGRGNSRQFGGLGEDREGMERTPGTGRGDVDVVRGQRGGVRLEPLAVNNNPARKKKKGHKPSKPKKKKRQKIATDGPNGLGRSNTAKSGGLGGDVGQRGDGGGSGGAPMSRAGRRRHKRAMAAKANQVEAEPEVEEVVEAPPESPPRRGFVATAFSAIKGWVVANLAMPEMPEDSDDEEEAATVTTPRVQHF